MNTGFTCDLPNCRCHGVHFPSLDRLARHKTYERSLKNKEFKQCTGALCGCGKLFANLTSHLNAVRKKNQQEDLQRKQKVPGSYMSDEEQEEDDDTHHMDEDVEDSGYISMSNSRQLSTRIRIKKENEGHVDDAPTFRQTRSTKRKQPAVETNAHKKDPDQHARLASIKRETIEADMDEDSNSTSDEDIIAAPRKRRLVKRSDIENVQTFHTEKNPPADPSKVYYSSASSGAQHILTGTRSQSANSSKHTKSNRSS